MNVGENPTKESTIATSSEKIVKQNEKEKMNVDQCLSLEIQKNIGNKTVSNLMAVKRLKLLNVAI